MTDEERAEVIRRQRALERAREEARRIINEAVEHRNSYLHELYNGYRADPGELRALTDIRSESTFYAIIRGPRTGLRRAVSQTPKLQERIARQTEDES